VIGVAESNVNRRRFEDRFAVVLSGPRADASPSYGYYGTTYDVLHEPGYTVTRTIVRLETNLYDVATGELVWSGQSETLDTGSRSDSIDSVTEAVAERLREEGLIP